MLGVRDRWDQMSRERVQGDGGSPPPGDPVESAREVRAAEGKYERRPAIAAELVRLRVDIIFAPNGPTVEAAKNATTNIPIVMAAVTVPVGRGLLVADTLPSTSTKS